MEPAIQRIVDRVQSHQPMHVEAVLPPSLKPKLKDPGPKPQGPRPKAEVMRISEALR